MTQIRPLQYNDFPAWLPLWDSNNKGIRDETITTQTWARLLDPDFPIYGLCAIKGGNLVGLVHYVLHPTTGAIQPACYMQDVFVDPKQRNKGIGRKLIKAITLQSKKEKWSRLYWLAERSNEAAQGLYKDIGTKLDFTLHILPTGQ